MKDFIYPDYDISEAFMPKVDIAGHDNIWYHSMFSTKVRKRFEGKWYLIKVVTRQEIAFTDSKELDKFRQEAQKFFIRECYKCLMFYKIDKALDLNIEGTGKWSVSVEIDPNQNPEEDRFYIVSARYNAPLNLKIL